MFEASDRLSRRIKQVERARYKHTLIKVLLWTAIIISIVIFMIYGSQVKSPNQYVLGTVLLAIILVGGYLVFVWMDFKDFAEKSLFILYGTCVGIKKINSRYHHENSMIVRLDDGSIMKDIEVQRKLLEACSIDDSVLLVFTGKDNKYPSYIYRIERRDDKVRILRW